MKQVRAIKRWFLEKNHLNGLYQKEFTTVKETGKAVLVSYIINGRTYQDWIPKSVVIDEWEKDTSNFGYHDYLAGVYHEAYDKQVIPNHTIKSGRNVYRGDNFIHQMTTAELIKSLQIYGVQFMTRDEWNNR